MQVSSEFSGPENSSFEYIDIGEFYKSGREIKQKLKKLSEESVVSPFEADLQKDEGFSGVNPALVAKWVELFETHSDDKELTDIIATEDANLKSDSARKEADLARRIARSQLNSVKIHNEECMRLGGGSSRAKGPVNPGVPPNATFQGSVTIEERQKERASEDDVIISVTFLPGGRPSQMQMVHKQEIEFKATDSLAALQREIYCISKRLTKDCFIKDPSEECLIESSTFIFMENTFYDDPLDGTSASRPADAYFEALQCAGKYSGAAHALSSNLNTVKRESLKDTCWNNLRIRLNTPYLLVHLGGCEHVFYVNQVRHASTNDLKNIEFPHTCHALRVRRRKCRICEVYAGSKMILNDKLMPENPCIICDKCFEGFHGKDKKWYSDFEVVPYYHES